MVFLKYKTKRPMLLHSGRKNYESVEHLCDGYIDTEDHVEIFLKNASDIVDENYEELDFDSRVGPGCICHLYLSKK